MIDSILQDERNIQIEIEMPRRSGKTYQAVELAKKYDVPIMVLTKKQAKKLKEKFGVKTYTEINFSNEEFCKDIKKHGKNILIFDDMQPCLGLSYVRFFTR